MAASGIKNNFLNTFKHLTRAAAGGARVPCVTKPIVSAPMNGWAGPKLVAAVAHHGGLPMFPVGYFTDPAKILKDLQVVPPLITSAEATADTTVKESFLPYGVGFITFWLDKQGPGLLLDILKGYGDLPANHNQHPRPPAAIWFSFGDYRPYLKLIREHGLPGTKVIVQVQTVHEALDAQRHGVDVIALQGTESGGHGAQRVWPLMSFLPEATAALQKNAQESGSKLFMPAILAAGGISIASQYNAVRALGASGVVIGTGFLPTHESLGSQKAKDRLVSIQDGGISTTRTRIYDELRGFDWPQGYDGRVVRNLVTDREEEYQKKHGNFGFLGSDSFKVLKEDRTGTKQDWEQATKEQNLDLLPLWCGTGVGMLNKQTSAAEFMDQLLETSQLD